MTHQIGEYVLGDQLTALPYGELVEAHGPGDSHPLALLVFAERLAGDPTFAQAVWREAPALRSVSNPGIVRALNADAHTGGLTLTYARPAGQNLGALLASGSELTREQSMSLVHSLAAGLDAAHKRGFVHGLLAPAGVFVADDGTGSVVGLGLALACDEATQTDVARSRTDPGYLAPEQFDGPLNQRSADGYALGALAFTLLTGAPPTAPVEEADIADATTSGPESAEALVLAGVLRRQLARDPQRRFATGLEFSTALYGALGLTPAPLVTPPARHTESVPTHLDATAGSASGSPDQPAANEPERVQTERKPAPRAPQRPFSPPPAPVIAQTETATPAMLAAMRASDFSYMKLLLILILLNGGVLVFGAVMKAPPELSISLVGLISVVVVGAVLYERRKQQRDARVGQVRRVTGAIRLARVRGGDTASYAMYLVDGRRFLIDQQLFDHLRKQSTRVTDDGYGTSLSSLLGPSGDSRTASLTTVYTPTAGLVIEITDARGNPVYRNPKYHP